MLYRVRIFNNICKDNTVVGNSNAYTENVSLNIKYNGACGFTSAVVVFSICFIFFRKKNSCIPLLRYLLLFFCIIQ